MKHSIVITALAASLLVPALAHADDTHAFVHLRGDGTELQRRSVDTDGWVPVCEAPCDCSVVLGIEYRIGGNGIRPSEPFYLEHKPRIELDANVATVSNHRAGVGIAALGGGVTVLGGVLIATAFIAANNPYTALGDAVVTGLGGTPQPSTVDTHVARRRWRHDRGGVAGTAIGGIVLAATNQKTTVTQSATLSRSRDRAPHAHMARGAHEPDVDQLADRSRPALVGDVLADNLVASPMAREKTLVGGQVRASSARPKIAVLTVQAGRRRVAFFRSIARSRTCSAARKRSAR